MRTIESWRWLVGSLLLLLTPPPEPHAQVLVYFVFICLDFAVPEIILSIENNLFTDT